MLLPLVSTRDVQGQSRKISNNEFIPIVHCPTVDPILVQFDIAIIPNYCSPSNKLNY